MTTASTRPVHLAIVVAATTAVQAAQSFGCLALPAIAPNLGQALGLDAALVGYWVSVVYGGAMITSLTGGTFVRRLGAARTSQAALGFCAAGALLATAPWLPAMGLGAFLIGIGYGLTNPASSHLLARASSPTNRNLIFSIKQTGVPLGGVLAGLVAPPLALALGWQSTLVAVAVAALALALALQPARAGWDGDRDPATRLRQAPLAGLKLIWTRPPLRWLSLAAFAFAAVQLCLTTFLVAMLVGEAGFSLIAAGVVLSVVQVAGALGRLAWGALADRIGSSLAVLALLGFAMTVAAAATGLLGPGWPAAAVWALLLLFGASAIGWNGVYLAEVARVAPADQVSRATGGSLFFTFGGVLFGPSLFALGFGAIGSYTATYAALALVAAVGLMLVMLSRRA